MGKIFNYFGGLILKDGELVHGDVWIRDGKFVDPESVGYQADVSVECFDTVLAPGFLDLKCNGAYGVDFQNLDALKSGLNKARREVLKSGVTQFCVSLITKDAAFYKQALSLIAKAPAHPTEGAGIMGAHLDGPFISVAGAHPKEFVRHEISSLDTITEVYGNDLEQVAILAIAPELPGALEVIPSLKRWGIKVTIGHSKADIRTGEQAVHVGASMISHLFNAMPNFHHRDPSIVGLVTSDNVKDIRYTLISDGHHIHPAGLRMAYRMAPDGMILITDGQAPLGLGLGDFQVSDTAVQVIDQDKSHKPTCVLKGTDTLFGSVCPMNRGIRNLVEMADCPLSYALECATKRPAEVMGLYPQKGSLQIGADADFVILDPVSLDVHATFISGHKVYDKGSLASLKSAPQSHVAS
eukprot:Blabericola_migrator_1__5040@NODE_2611_length_2537_cov_275_580972_g1368_i1_p1_GENE_NODE_2611_length_2537_cov_275_580972_g1368_i1NODE_2611_length_2537_cov_275_580972_g1368_i1_p1_ORF_typecomplete_len411_score74_16Amidohydro_1/PF01979_20/1_6e29Amidohydro_3/PF07969_11/8_6e02Amidohydro_3/PF07969_11/8_9e10_NODE_2611_length_2537_cov_275_580972_g1368_i11071339